LIGRIYERNGFPDAVRFFWSLHGVALTRAPDIHTDGHTPSLEVAKAEFKSNWLRWLEWPERAEVEMTRLEQRGGGASAFMAAAPWIMLPIAAAILAETDRCLITSRTLPQSRI
jgi:hypothetical protein